MTTDQTMTTRDVANRLVSLCREGKVLEAGEELYGDNIESIEPAGSFVPSTKGKKATREKGNQFAAMIEQHHSGLISDPLVAGNHFTIHWSMEVTLKGRGRQKMEEIAVYEVKDGKVVREQFFA